MFVKGKQLLFLIKQQPCFSEFFRYIITKAVPDLQKKDDVKLFHQDFGPIGFVDNISWFSFYPDILTLNYQFYVCHQIKYLSTYNNGK